MKKALILPFLLLTAALHCTAQDYSVFDSLLVRYYAALETEDMESRMAECDWIISQCKDSSMRRHVAVSIYSHYVDSHIMGEEAVAIHVYDKWFATDSVRMYNDLDKINAGIFADFNRNTLIGMKAPILTMKDIKGRRTTFPSTGTSSIIMFYDTSCPTCKAESALLPSVIGNIDFPVNFYCVYSGSDKKAWKNYIKERLTFNNENVKVYHLWDPGIDSDFQRLYGVLTTPRTYVTEPQGTIIGRRLEPGSLAQILIYAAAIQAQYDKYSQRD